MENSHKSLGELQVFNRNKLRHHQRKYTSRLIMYKQTFSDLHVIVFLQIYSRLGEDENRHESGVTAICTILMNYVEIYKTRNNKTKSYQKFEDRLRDISKCNLTFYYTGNFMFVSEVYYPECNAIQHSKGKGDFWILNVTISNTINVTSMLECNGTKYTIFKCNEDARVYKDLRNVDVTVRFICHECNKDILM